MKKTFLLLFLAVLALSGCKVQNKSTGENPLQNQVGIANPASIYCEQEGGQLEIRTDEQGNQIAFCIFADNSECEEWKFFRAQCQPASQAEDINKEIKQLFIQKYNKAQDEVSITINQQTPNYARGGVKFGRDGIGEGGIFLATNTEGYWELVFDGNGMIPCSLLEGYDFPEVMVPDCLVD